MVVALVDAAILERSLYLVAELVTLPAPVVVGLNMIDVAEQEGVHIEPEVLEAALGIPVVPMIATRNIGVRELLETVDRVAKGEIVCNPKSPQIRQDHQEVLEEIEEPVSYTHLTLPTN